MHPDRKWTLTFREWPPRARLTVSGSETGHEHLGEKGLWNTNNSPCHGATHERRSWDRALRWKGFAKAHKNEKRSKTRTLRWCQTPTEDAPLRGSHKPQWQSRTTTMVTRRWRSQVTNDGHRSCGWKGEEEGYVCDTKRAREKRVLGFF